MTSENSGKRSARTDDFSTDPRKWSYDKLRRERPHGMPAVLAEWSRRMDELSGS